MAVAVVVFITGAANDLNLVPPLMLAVTIALLLNKLINERGFDEEQILRKAIPFLGPDPPHLMDRIVALDLRDDLPQEAVLPPEAEYHVIKLALEQKKVNCFPVIKEGNICIGFATRVRLEAALQAWEDTGMIEAGEMRPKAESPTEVTGDSNPLGKLISATVARETSFSGTMLPVFRLTERSPYTILQDMPGPRLYAIFAKAGAKAACVVSEKGEFKGMITRGGLIEQARRCEEAHDTNGDFAEEDTLEDEEELGLVIPR